MTKLHSNQSVIYPIDLSDYSLENCELFCSCGCYINEHDNGICENSVCENECGCVSCDFDFELSVMMNYFQGQYDRWFIQRLTTDCKKQYTLGHHGIPMMKERYQMTVRRNG
jgi:hypothetical protein